MNALVITVNITVVIMVIIMVISMVHTMVNITIRWVMERDGGHAGVQCIDNFDITGDGVRDLIMARHDGSIEVYSYDDGEDLEPTLKTTHNCGESVTGLEGGVVGQQGYEEVVAATYTGKVFGLSSLPSGGGVAGGRRVTQEAAARLAKLRSEVEELSGEVGKERERYQSQAVSSLGGMSAIPRLSITDSMTLNQTDASYMLSLECQTAIDNVLLQSDVPVDLLDVEKNSAVVSFSSSSRYFCEIHCNALDMNGYDFHLIDARLSDIEVLL